MLCWEPLERESNISVVLSWVVLTILIILPHPAPLCWPIVLSGNNWEGYHEKMGHRENVFEMGKHIKVWMVLSISVEMVSRDLTGRILF